MRVIRVIENVFLWAVPLALILIWGTARSGALPYGAGTYGSCTYGTCSISVSTSGTVNLPVTPTDSGVSTTVSDEITVETGSSTGYTLTFSDSDTATTLVNGANSVPAASGSQASPVSLPTNTWGYRVDGLGGFGNGPTSAQDSAATALYTFAGVPASNDTPHTLKTTSAAASPPDVTTVWYGVRMDGTKPSGTYTDQVTYTAVTND